MQQDTSKGRIGMFFIAMVLSCIEHSRGLTVSILEALGLFLGFLVNAVLIKLWKAGDLKGYNQRGEHTIKPRPMVV